MDKKISELDQALQINNDAVFPFSQDNSGTETTYKASITQLASEIGEDQTYSNLQTTSKNLVGAINEVAQGGGGGGSSNANIAPDYDSTSTYAVGDWCIYNGTLYQCTTAITVAEAFDPTHWTAKKVVDAFDDIDTALSGKVETSNFYGKLLPMSTTEPNSMVADRIEACETAISGKADTSDIPTRSDFIRYEDVTIGAVEFTNAYYLLPSGSRPTVPSGYMFLMGVMLDYGSIQSGTSAVITINQNGTYLFGIAGSKYSNVKVRYIYIKR